MSVTDPHKAPAPLRLAVLAGEPSGDLLAAEIVDALQTQLGVAGVELMGVAGPQMAARGLKSLYPMDTLTVMGLTEVLPRLRSILAIIRGSAKAIADAKPDIVLSVDSPDFGFRVQKKLAKSLPDTPRVHMVAPTVWAWRPGRAKKISKFLTHILTLFPFEPPYFTAHGLKAHFVGHPVVRRMPKGEEGAFRAAHNIASDAPLLAVLPGSRMGEVSSLLEPFGETVEALHKDMPNLRVVIPTVPNVEQAVRQGVANWPGDPVIVLGDEARFQAFRDSTAALAASGTVSLELTVANVPTVVAYMAGGLTIFIVRRMVSVDYMSLTNIILNREVIPEFLQSEVLPVNMVAALKPLLLDARARAKQQAAFAEVLDALGKSDDDPAKRAADILIDIWKGQSQ